MTPTKFETLLPWSGAVAGACWVGQDLLQHWSTRDRPGAVRAEVVEAHLVSNIAAVGCLVLMGISLLFFATAVRNQLRSGEAREATYSSIAHGGWVVAVAGLSQMVLWSWGLIRGAADAGDDGALRILSFVGYFGWAGMGIGVATAMIATGLGGSRNAVLPRWFSIASVVLGVLAALGDAGIPPGGLVTYLLLPVWLVTASVVLARRQRREQRLPASTAGSSSVAAS